MNIENINLMGTQYINRGFNCVLICSTSADIAAKTVSAPSAFALDTNCSFEIKFTNGNTAAAPTLAVNTTGAKSLTFLGSSTLKANLIYECYFDGTNYVLDNSVTEASVASANKLTTARKTYVTLGTASTTTARDWSGDTTIPVDGILDVANGGTGSSTAAGARTNLGLGSAAVKTAGSAAGNVPLVGTVLGTTNNNIVVTDASGQVKPFGKTPDQIAYWGNGGGVCTTAAATEAKTVSISGFALYTGVTVKVMFTNGNSNNAPTLNVNSTGAKSIKVVKAGAKITPPVHTGKWRGASSATTEAWQPLTTLELMYDGTDWVIIGNPVVEDYYSASQGYTVYANGLTIQFFKTTTNNNTPDVSFPIAFESNVISINGTIIDFESEMGCSSWNVTKTGFKKRSAGGSHISWTAIGY